MKTRAAVLVKTGQPLVLAELEVPPLQAGQVLVAIAFSGACHTQILECRGYRGDDPYLPHCLGHEGSGTVLEVGPHVTKVKPGDRVILSWIKGSGADASSPAYRWDGRLVNGGGITTFSRHSVISENRLTLMPEGLDMRQAAMIGCTIPTGMGAVFNTAKVQPHQSIAIFGAGGIGLCAITGAAIAGCAPVIAIDVRPEKLELAKRLGASHCIDAASSDVVEQMNRICRSGVDFAIEATGRPEVIVHALLSVRNQGGTVVVIGNARYGERVELDPRQLNLGKRLLGTWGGDNWPDADFPRYAELVRTAWFSLEPILSRTYGLSKVNEALNDLEVGEIVRPLIDMAID